MSATEDIFAKIDNKASEVRKSSFRKNKSRKHYRRRLDGNKKSISVDDFGNPYRAVAEEDKTSIISITLPQSLILILDEKRKNIPRSRYLREMVEFCLSVEQVV